MKKTLGLVLSICLLCLSGCAQYPDQAADGMEWDESWTMLGSVLGIEAPGDDLVLLDNNSVLTGDDLYYASWAVGESTPYINEDGDEVDLYDAQLYLLLAGCADGAYAQQNVYDWIAREQETYTVLETKTEIRNRQEYTLLVYECGSDTNPYSHGVSAFTVYDNYALSAELACQDTYSAQETDVLLRFLDGVHYSAELG